MSSSEPTTVLRGTTGDGFEWVLRAQSDSPSSLMTMLAVTGRGRRGEGGFGGPPLYPGQLINSWIGSRDGQPTFVALRADPSVPSVDVIERTGRAWRLDLSDVDERFGLRFGVMRVPDGAEIVEIRGAGAASFSQIVRTQGGPRLE